MYGVESDALPLSIFNMFATSFQAQEKVALLRNVVSSQDQECLLEWPNIIHKAKGEKYEKHILESSFTVFSNLSGQVSLEVGGRSLRVCEQTVLIVNPFQTVHYQIDAKVSVFNIHFNYRQYKQLIGTLTRSSQTLLDHPDVVADQTVFTEQLHVKDLAYMNLINQFEPTNEDDFLLSLVTYLVQKEQKSQIRLADINATKHSVKKELQKRMFQAKDFMYSYYDAPDFSLDRLCQEIGMSKFHFLRVFKHFFGYTPHQFLKRIRLSRASYLLQYSDYEVQEIAYRVGYQEANSFYQVFKQFFKQSPLNYRMTVRA